MFHVEHISVQHYSIFYLQIANIVDILVDTIALIYQA